MAQIIKILTDSSFLHSNQTGNSKKSNPNLTDWQIRIQSNNWKPPTDVFELEEIILVRVEIAGMKEEDFSISYHKNFLNLRGSRKDEMPIRSFQQMEIIFSEFNFNVHIPQPIDSQNIAAEYKEGFLLISLPIAKTKVIEIKKND